MALIQCDYFSEVMGLSCSMNVILPQATRSQIGMRGQAAAGKYRVLWLLHGLSDDHTIWCRRTSIERYVAPLGLAVIMPAAGRSFYQNIHRGLAYRDHLLDELPGLARSFFPLSDRREDNFVAGLSMGGYGAFSFAMARPQSFAAAASLSGALNLAANLTDPDPSRRVFMEAVFEDVARVPDSDADLFHLAGRMVEPGARPPRFYACCGRQDFLLQQNRDFAARARSIGLPLTYEENEGAHEWGYWDRMIVRVLEWMLAEG